MGIVHSALGRSITPDRYFTITHVSNPSDLLISHDDVFLFTHECDGYTENTLMEANETMKGVAEDPDITEIWDHLIKHQKSHLLDQMDYIVFWKVSSFKEDGPDHPDDGRNMALLQIHNRDAKLKRKNEGTLRGNVYGVVIRYIPRNERMLSRYVPYSFFNGILETIRRYVRFV